LPKHKNNMAGTPPGGEAPASVEAPPVVPPPEASSTALSGDVQAWVDIGKGLSESDRAAALRHFAETPPPSSPTETPPPPTTPEPGRTISPEAIAAMRGESAGKVPEAAPVGNPALEAAQQRVSEGKGTRDDLDLLDKAKAEAATTKRSERETKVLAEASKAYAEGRATEKQKALVRADAAERAKAVANEKRADYDKLNERVGNGDTLTPEEEIRRAGYETEKEDWEKLAERAEAGEELNDDEKRKLEDGNDVWGDKEDEAAVSETEEAKLERLQAELEANTDAMLTEKDPAKRAELMDKVAEQRATLLDMKQSTADRERDKTVIKDVFTGKRSELVNDKKSERNEKLQLLIDQLLANAAELLVISRQMEAVDKQRQQLKAEINNKRKTLGHFSTPMDKFVQVQEVAPLYRQLVNLDDRVDQMADASFTYADKYYKTLLAIRSGTKMRSTLGRVVESVALGSLRYTADIQKYSRRASRSLLGS
jgi:hypothetical protein